MIFFLSSLSIFWLFGTALTADYFSKQIPKALKKEISLTKTLILLFILTGPFLISIMFISKTLSELTNKTALKIERWLRQ